MKNSDSVDRQKVRTGARRGQPAVRRATPPRLALARRRLRELRDPDVAPFLQGFFKTGPGQYAEGDRFLGIRVPLLRRLARELRGLPRRDIEALLRDPWHEARLLALLLMLDAYDRGSSATREAIFRSYLRNVRFINNWDLVDASAAGIVGRHLASGSRSRLTALATSNSLWERRIAIVATFHFIRNGDYDDTLRIAELLLGDSHDLIHKASGWMLREVGKRDRAHLERFLDAHARVMPRTMLRYAIERMPEAQRARYMAR